MGSPRGPSEEQQLLQQQVRAEFKGGKGCLKGDKGKGELDIKGFDELFKPEGTPEPEGKGVLEELCVGQ